MGQTAFMAGPNEGSLRMTLAVASRVPATGRLHDSNQLNPIRNAKQSRPVRSYFSELMSMTKRYFTSCFNMRSKASLIF
jgi:hypothetical protein